MSNENDNPYLIQAVVRVRQALLKLNCARKPLGHLVTIQVLIQEFWNGARGAAFLKSSLGANAADPRATF